MYLPTLRSGSNYLGKGQHLPHDDRPNPRLVRLVICVHVQHIRVGYDGPALAQGFGDFLLKLRPFAFPFIPHYGPVRKAPSVDGADLITILPYRERQLLGRFLGRHYEEYERVETGEYFVMIFAIDLGMQDRLKFFHLPVNGYSNARSRIYKPQHQQ
jgi:hypothetical protein